ncbi:hypothetical protein BH23GEM6_BH23GEM6_05050 [soil metagenome]
MTTNSSAPAGFRGTFLSDAGTLALHGSASGILARLPRAVAAPADADDLSLLVTWAAEQRIPLVPRGAGTGMPGGNVGDGIALDLLSGFQTVPGVNAERRRVTVQPGVTLDQLNEVCAPAGMSLPVDPSSSARCTLGGMIANNSAGAHSVKYGSTRAWVESLDLVLASGAQVRVARGTRVDDPELKEIIAQIDSSIQRDRAAILSSWPRVRKNSSGYALKEYLETGEPIDLIIGSEGTLALITSATLRLAPVPACRGVALLEFSELNATPEVIQRILPLQPATCEMLDRSLLEILRLGGADQDYPLSADLQAILLVEMEGDSPADVRQALESVESVARPGADRITLAIDPVQQQRLWSLRHRASPLIAERAGRRFSMQFIEDCVVPIAALPEYIRLLREVLERHDLPAVIFGHAGDGNLHVNPLVDISVPEWTHTLENVMTEVAEGVARIGGTLAGEHGDGRLRAPLLETIWGSEMIARFRLIKNAFDPRNILNPGVILPLPGQRPLDALKSFT